MTQKSDQEAKKRRWQESSSLYCVAKNVVGDVTPLVEGGDSFAKQASRIPQRSKFRVEGAAELYSECARRVQNSECLGLWVNRNFGREGTSPETEIEPESSYGGTRTEKGSQLWAVSLGFVSDPVCALPTFSHASRGQGADLRSAAVRRVGLYAYRRYGTVTPHNVKLEGEGLGKSRPRLGGGLG